MRLQAVLGAVRLLRTFGRWESEKAGRGYADVENGKDCRVGKATRQRNSGKDTAAQKKASQPYRMTGGAAMRDVRVL